MKDDHRSKFSNLSKWNEEAWKNQGLNGIWTRDLHDTGAMLSSNMNDFHIYFTSILSFFFVTERTQLNAAHA